LEPPPAGRLGGGADAPLALERGERALLISAGLQMVGGARGLLQLFSTSAADPRLS
jgi:hypothetical protein